MKRFRSCVAVLLSAVLMFTTQEFSVLASESLDIVYEEDILTETSGEAETTPVVDIISDTTALNDAGDVVDIMSDTEAPDEAVSDDFASDDFVSYDFASDDVLYLNTGDAEYHLVSGEKDKDDNRAYSYDSQGNFDIPIYEENPFFPYEVQFRSGGETWTEWFVTPSSTIEINGHLIGVRLLDEAYTSVTLNVGGRDVIVYPEEKTFTDPSGFSLDKSLSLQPLTEKNLSEVDLTGFSPAELTMVSTSVIFKGENVSGDVVWNYYNYDDDDEYTISRIGDTIDLSRRTYSSYFSRLEMIVGKADQLAPDNIRYIIPVSYKLSRSWLNASAALKTKDGKKTAITIDESYPYYSDFWTDSRYLYIDATLSSTHKSSSDDVFYVSLSNGSVFPAAASVKFYEGKFTDVNKAVKATDITAKLWNTDPVSKDGGYQVKNSSSCPVTMVTRDDKGKVTGCLPFYIELYARTQSSSEPS
nr:hypothetical protein [Lachnospiraceae bacterium]